MKPAADLDISAKHAARLRGGDVQPLSKLATRIEEQRAEHYSFTEQDRALLEAALAEGTDGDGRA